MKKLSQSRRKYLVTIIQKIYTHIYLNCCNQRNTAQLKFGKTFERAFYKKGHPGGQELVLPFIDNKGTIN